MMAPGGTDAGRALSYRPDIDGLRAVAVLLIVLFHAGVPAIPGGYVGVDVFFVISGFLITGLLVKELGESGTLSLREFYARRARRILPASFLVLAVTLIGTAVFFSPVGFWHATPGLVASAAYVPNLLFAKEVADYFHPVRVSPVIHYWSLGVEEQFYVFYPAFLLVAQRFAARGGPRVVAWVVAAVIASMALSLVWTAASPTSAFYLLPTRAWELGAGALLAFAGLRTRAIGTRIANGAGALGIALIAGSAVLFTSSTAFPGVAALVPVAGTVLVIAGGGSARASWPARALAWAPMRYIGRISYSLYLWHWPVIVFGGIALAGIIPDGIEIILALALTFGLSAATFRWVEDPLRHGQIVGLRASRNLATALVASVVIVALTLAGRTVVGQRFAGGSIGKLGPGATDSLAGLIPATGPIADRPLPRDAVPSLLDLGAGKTLINPYINGCSLRSPDTVNGRCTYGDPAAPEVVLLGDSHITQWWPALEPIMMERGWKVVFLIKTSCTYADITTVTASGPKTECDTWRKGALARIAADRPALVIVSSNHRAPPIVNDVVLYGPAAVRAMADGAARTIASLQADGARVVVIGDTPQLSFDPGDCLSTNADHVIRCAAPRATAVEPDWLAAERATTEQLGATFVDSAAWVCPSDPCPAVIGRYVVYSDTNHLTDPFVIALSSRLEAAIPR